MNFNEMKELLKSGNVTADSLLEDYMSMLKDAEEAAAKEKEAEAKAAQERKEKEAQKKEKEEKLSVLRATLICDLFDYLVALDIMTDEEVTNELFESLVNTLEETEEYFHNYTKMFKIFGVGKDKDEDAVIKTFIQDLML